MKKFNLLWVGSEFETSWLIATLVIIPLTLVLTHMIGISILQAKNKNGFRALTLLAISIINILLSVFLAKNYGALGASFGTSLSLIFGNLIVLNINYHYRIGLNILRFLKNF